MEQKTYKVQTMGWTETPWEIGLFNKTSMVRDLTADPKHLKELLERYDE